MKMVRAHRTVVSLELEKAENWVRTWIGGHPRRVICLGFMLDIGDIKEPVDGRYRREGTDQGHVRAGAVGEAGRRAGEPGATTRRPYTAELERLAGTLGGEPVRNLVQRRPVLPLRVLFSLRMA